MGQPNPSTTLSVTVNTATKLLSFHGAGFWHLSFLSPVLHYVKGNSVISKKNKGTSFWNFVLNSGLISARLRISIVETCYQLSSRKVDASSPTERLLLCLPLCLLPLLLVPPPPPRMTCINYTHTHTHTHTRQLAVNRTFHNVEYTGCAKKTARQTHGNNSAKS